MTATDYARGCDPRFRAAHHGDEREPGTVFWIVLHDTEGGSAESVARFFARPPTKDTGSAHLVVDDDACFRCLPNNVIPWAAPGANTHGFHIEQCGFAKWASSSWLLHRDTLRRAAYKTAYHAVLFNIPPVFRFAADLKRTEPGITTHREVSKAFGGTHSDPGPFWPRRWFMARVREYYEQIANV